MPISVQCSGCSQKLKAKDSLAGRTLRCPKCAAPITVPTAEDAIADMLLTDGPGEASPAPVEAAAPTERPMRPSHEPPSPAPRAWAKPKAAPVKAITMKEPPLWLRHLHWALALLLVPLAISVALPSDEFETIITRLVRTIDRAPGDVQQRADQALERLEKGQGSVEELFDALPDNRLAGAFLPRRSVWHWAFAAATAAGFIAFLFLLATYQTEQPMHMLRVGLFTATIGIGFLLLVQTLAVWTAGTFIVGRSIFVVLFYIVKFIGFSYQAALDPENGFLLSFLGFTAGVGFCEEVVKALPLIWHYRERRRMGWRTPLIWGLASGAGFGIAEAVLYSGQYYNGVSGGGIYLVRYLSCVALHAIWTGSAAIALEKNQELVQKVERWFDYIPVLVRILAVPMILHGLYDTLLKKEMSGLALGAAVLSFLFLAFQLSRLQTSDDEREHASMLREYERRRKTMAAGEA